MIFKEQKRATINDVADRAGVSKRTVSRVINGSPRVSTSTRERIEKAIEQLEFIPNRHARSLAVRRSYLLGMVYDVPTLFVNHFQKGMLNVCEDAGYDVLVHACHVESDSLIDDVLHFIDRTHLDGVVLLPPLSEVTELVARLDAAGCCYVRFTSRHSNEPWKLVVTEYVPAICDMTNQLVDLGHHDFAFITGPPNHVSSQMRHEAFVRALRSQGLDLPPEMVAEGNFTYESGIRAARALFGRERRPTAIFAANDEMAFGVMSVANEMGLRIPDDLSVVGFDGTPFSTFVSPPLSTIVRNTDEMAHLGTQKLLTLVEKGPGAARKFETKVSPRYFPRGSTGPVPAG